MKINLFSVCVCVLTFCFSISGCAEIKTTTSHFGHGAYRCYFHNIHSGLFYDGTGYSEKKAAKMAKRACRDAEPEYQDKANCEFADCVFK